MMFMIMMMPTIMMVMCNLSIPQVVCHRRKRNVYLCTRASLSRSFYVRSSIDVTSTLFCEVLVPLLCVLLVSNNLTSLDPVPDNGSLSASTALLRPHILSTKSTASTAAYQSIRVTSTDNNI